MYYSPVAQEAGPGYPPDYDPSLNGVGGWLILIIIGRVLTFIFSIKDMSECLSAYGINATFDFILTVGIILDVTLGIVFSVLVIVFMFKQNIVFRTLFVIQVSVMFVFNLAVILYVNSLGISYGVPSLVGNIIGGLIWILYVYNSKRVRNTYIYPKYYMYKY